MPESSHREIVVTGATGLIGRRLMSRLASGSSSASETAAPSPSARGAGPGFGIRVLSRSVREDSPGRRHFVWDGIAPSEESLQGAEAVVHLAGEPIFGGLPTARRRSRIERSRVESTRRIVDRLSSLDPSERPRTFLCASAVGFYGDRGDEILDESAVAGAGFLAEVCRDWEAEAQRASSLGVRVVCIRIGVVFSREGGALALMRLPFSLGLGGRLGSGRQFFPWIHLDDVVEVFAWALESQTEGVINAVAPEEIRNIELTRALGKVLNRPTLLPVPSVALRAALGFLADELIGSRRVRPAKLESAGFEFRYPDLESALEAELG